MLVPKSTKETQVEQQITLGRDSCPCRKRRFAGGCHDVLNGDSTAAVSPGPVKKESVARYCRTGAEIGGDRDGRRDLGAGSERPYAGAAVLGGHAIVSALNRISRKCGLITQDAIDASRRERKNARGASDRECAGIQRCGIGRRTKRWLRRRWPAPQPAFADHRTEGKFDSSALEESNGEAVRN